MFFPSMPVTEKIYLPRTFFFDCFVYFTDSLKSSALGGLGPDQTSNFTRDRTKLDFWSNQIQNSKNESFGQRDFNMIFSLT